MNDWTAIWTAALALITACGGLCTGAVFVMRSIVRVVVSTEIAKLNGTYLRRELADERHHSHDRRLKRLELEAREQ